MASKSVGANYRVVSLLLQLRWSALPHPFRLYVIWIIPAIKHEDGQTNARHR
jgi:hypothetical protein